MLVEPTGWRTASRCHQGTHRQFRCPTWAGCVARSGAHQRDAQTRQHLRIPQGPPRPAATAAASSGCPNQFRPSFCAPLAITLSEPRAAFTTIREWSCHVHTVGLAPARLVLPQMVAPTATRTSSPELLRLLIVGRDQSVVRARKLSTSSGAARKTLTTRTGSCLRTSRTSASNPSVIATSSTSSFTRRGMMLY